MLTFYLFKKILIIFNIRKLNPWRFASYIGYLHTYAIICRVTLIKKLLVHLNSAKADLQGYEICESFRVIFYIVS